MNNDKTPKKKLGSVAVDSQTGMEHYNEPKKNLSKKSKKNTGDPRFRQDYTTPNFGEDSGSDAVQNRAGVGKEFLSLFEHDPSEVIVFEATRHPIGVTAIYAMAGVASLVVLIATVLLASDDSFFTSLGISGTGIGLIGVFVASIILLLIAVISYLAAMVYRKSRLILTNQKVVYIQYHSLVSREVSQLNIGEVEDVNVSQPTLLDRIFKTGRVTIETAGEQNNYVMTQVEHPYEFARRTIQMHEGSIAEYGN